MRFQDFLNFDKMIAGGIIKFLYWLGIVIIVLFGLGAITGSISTMSYNGALGLLQLVVAVVAIALGILLWRVICEMYLIFLSMNDKLSQIKDKLPDS
tara:strand:- start:1502 stop:1792 length:291 start_codon:yes stop_codon:yes gene_type:complete